MRKSSVERSGLSLLVGDADEDGEPRLVGLERRRPGGQALEVGLVLDVARVELARDLDLVGQAAEVDVQALGVGLGDRLRLLPHAPRASARARARTAMVSRRRGHGGGGASYRGSASRGERGSARRDATRRPRSRSSSRIERSRRRARRRPRRKNGRPNASTSAIGGQRRLGVELEATPRSGRRRRGRASTWSAWRMRLYFPSGPPRRSGAARSTSRQADVGPVEAVERHLDAEAGARPRRR